MNNFRNLLGLGILVFTSIIIGIPPKVFAADLPYITYEGSNLYISPTDNSDGTLWDPGSEPYTSITGAQSDTDGSLNTAAIVTLIGAGSYAAQICSDLSLEGYNDWYLPAIDQLQAMYDNTVNTEDGFTPLIDEWYWSSTELTTEFSVHFSIGEIPPETYARIVNFGTGGSDIYTKSSNVVPVRCVRSEPEVVPSVSHHHIVRVGSRVLNYESKTTISTNTSTSNFIFLNNLKPGMNHSDVKELQKFLNTYGFPISLDEAGSSSNETNKFGALTKTAVIKFQLANGLVGDGIVGPLTRVVLNK